MRGISATKAYQHVENICKFGNRLAGSAPDNKASEYFAATCSEYGLYTYFEEFETDCFEPITCELSLVEPISKNIEYNPMRFSPSTSEEGITSELVDGSNCSTDGDLICDTPADPNLQNIALSSCTYSGTYTDINGDLYSPDTSNIMSYAKESCINQFSNQR